MEQAEKIPLIEQAEVAFSLGQDGPGFEFFVAGGGSSAGAVVLPAYDEVIGPAGDGGLDHGPHVHRPLHGLLAVDGQLAGEDQGFLIEGVVGIEKGHLGPQILGVDRGAVAGRLVGCCRGFRLAQGQVGQLLDANMGLGEAELTQVQAAVGLDAGDGDLGAGHGVALGVVVAFQVDVQGLGTGGQIFPAGDQVPGHGDAVDVFEVCVLAHIGVAIGGQGGFDDGHIEAGVVGNEGFSRQHGVQLPPDGEKIRGLPGVLGVDPMDVDVPLVILVSRGLDQVMGGGDHLQADHKGQADGTGAVGVAGGRFEVDGNEIHMLVGRKGKGLTFRKRHEKNHSVLYKHCRDRRCQGPGGWPAAARRCRAQTLSYYSDLPGVVKLTAGKLCRQRFFPREKKK